MMPPAPIRRPLTITTWVVVSTVVVSASPLLLAAGAAAAAVLHRPQARVLVRLVVEYFARELFVLVACAGLWVAAGFGIRIHAPRFERAHYRLLRWFVAGLAARARALLRVAVDPGATPEARRALLSDRPLLFFSRHAGPGDTVLLTDLLMTSYDRLPSVVFKDVLTLDPCIDLLGHRLPHAVLDRGDSDECEARIAEVAAELHRRGTLVLFPEGGNFTPQRRRRSIAALWRKGHAAAAVAGEQMANVIPPHPGGALAALRGNPGCDVVFSAHAGLGLAAFPRELWREPPFDRTFTTQMWLVPAAERPQDPAEQVRWLYDWWARIDDWVQAQPS